MAFSKIIETIQALSSEEKKEFSLYLKSPFFLEADVAEGYLRLFYGLLDIASDQQMVLSNKLELHAAIFPDKSFSALRLERVFTKLIQLVETFLVTKNYLREGNQQRRALDLASIYREKRLASLYGKNLNKLKKMNEEAPLEAVDNNFLRFQIAVETFDWLSTFNKGKGDLAIPSLVEHLDLFYETTRLRFLNIFLLQQKNSGNELANTPWFLSNANRGVHPFELKFPLYLIEKKIHDLLLMEVPSIEKFDSLSALIKDHESELGEDTVKNFYTFLRNFCTMLFIEDNDSYLYKMHQILQDHLERGYFHYNGQITPSALLNIVSVAIKANNIEWAKQVVESNQYNILAGEEAEDIYKLNMAICLFAEKKIETSLQYLTFPATNPVYTLFARRLELKLYYELQSPLLSYKIDAFRKYLERTALTYVSDAHRAHNLNFLHLFAQMSRSTPRNAQRSARLIERINGKKDLCERAWLLEKAKALQHVQ
jgi:hypothetical protein